MKIKIPYDFEPRHYQQRFMSFMDNGGRYAYCVWHRRAGKDIACLNQVAKMAMERQGLYWYLLPNLRQARRAVWSGFRNDGRPLIPTVFPESIVRARNEQDMKLELVNGSVVQVLGSDSHDALVGANPHGIVMSEFALSKPTAWSLLSPILTANGGWAIFNTTPRGMGQAYDQWKLATSEQGKKDGWYTELQNIYQTGIFPDPEAVMESERRRGMPESWIKSEYLCDWSASLVGSVWGDLMDDLGKRGGLGEFNRETVDVHTSWDLGISDSTAIWFWRVNGDGIEFIDHLEAHGKPLSYYADEIENRPWKVIKHWLPHDARARTLVTGSSVYEQLTSRFGSGRVQIGPKLSLMDGIQAGRWLLQKEGTRFHSSCENGIDALKNFHYEFDADLKTYSSKPEHDWSSHTADAFRYAAVVARQAGIMDRAGKVKYPIPRPSFPHGIHLGWTLDELVAATPKKSRRI